MDGFPIMGAPDTGDTAWVLASAALVLLMTPGLAFFYGGMVRAKGVLNMLMMCISSMGLVRVLWVLYGYSMAFGNDKFNVVGDPTQYCGLKGIIGGNAVGGRRRRSRRTGVEAADAVNIPLAGTIPMSVFVAFQLMFAIITVALISRCGRRPPEVRRLAAVRGPVGHVRLLPASRTGCFAFDGFTGETGGWIANKLAAIDFAGGTAVHINAGMAGLVLAIMLGKRKGLARIADAAAQPAVRDARRGLLWFGWYGFNAGSARRLGQ